MTMSNKDLTRALRALRALLDDDWKSRSWPKIVEIPAEELASYEKEFHGLDNERRLKHLAYMCVKADAFFERAGSDRSLREKGMRWLGFIQGALWWSGIASIEQLKSMNRSEENSRGD